MNTQAATPISRNPFAEGNLSPEGWIATETVDGIRLYRHEIDGSAIPALRAETLFQATPQQIYEIISDYDHFTAFVPQVEKSRILKQAGNTLWVYQRLSFPPPFAARQYVLQSSDQLSRPEKLYFRVNWTLDQEQSRELLGTKDSIPTAFAGFWELRPGQKDHTTATTYAVYLDPGGKLPAWLVDRGTRRLLPALITAIRKKLQRF
ncbi:SRPBCC family protein [Nitrosococcus oceani]|uniref:SRPBCC family protein n=1 Tax=Nitrosococcus oceani TaxID=1229 RepID=UPI0004E8DCFC|nr:SRPBCC family protein [Nitrosococcus oceani]KFI22127.1 cyclase [Nitrosococcus oceani]